MTKELLIVALTLYRFLILTTQVYTESLLNDRSAPDGYPYNLQWVLTLTAQVYMVSLCMTEALLMVALTVYIGSSS